MRVLWKLSIFDTARGYDLDDCQGQSLSSNEVPVKLAPVFTIGVAGSPDVPPGTPRLGAIA